MKAAVHLCPLCPPPFPQVTVLIPPPPCMYVYIVNKLYLYCYLCFLIISAILLGLFPDLPVSKYKHTTSYLTASPQCSFGLVFNGMNSGCWFLWSYLIGLWNISPVIISFRIYYFWVINCSDQSHPVSNIALIVSHYIFICTIYCYFYKVFCSLFANFHTLICSKF